MDSPHRSSPSRQPELRYVAVGGAASAQGGARRLACWEWACADPASRHLVICVHGLSRQGRDFDTLARSLTAFARVVAVDVAGRGHSDWLADPMQYQVPTYVVDLMELLQELRSGQSDCIVDWVGTSMGGLIGMAVAAQPAARLRRLVLNDVGPVIQWSALQRIADYLGRDPVFPTQAETFRYLASISTGFGVHSEAEWIALNEAMLRPRAGGYGLHYDPAIARPLQALLGAADPAAVPALLRQNEQQLWQIYDAITSETLVLRGADSDLLSETTALEMTRRGPAARVVTFQGVGHAPTLMAAEQVGAVCAFLQSPLGSPVA